MNYWYYYAKAVFTPIECAEIISFAMEHEKVVGMIGHGGSNQQHEMRKSSVRWLDAADVRLIDVVAKMRKHFHKANASFFGFDVDDFSALQFTEYHAENEGKYDWHEDNSWIQSWEPKKPKPPQFDRKLSMVIQMTDTKSYSGGVLELDPSKVTITDGHFTSQGDLIVFPSFLRHRVTPVTEGVRHSLVTWMEGPRFR